MLSVHAAIPITGKVELCSRSLEMCVKDHPQKPTIKKLTPLSVLIRRALRRVSDRSDDADGEHAINIDDELAERDTATNESASPDASKMTIVKP